MRRHIARLTDRFLTWLHDIWCGCSALNWLDDD
jgi:hypothetical protein